MNSRLSRLVAVTAVGTVIVGAACSTSVTRGGADRTSATPLVVTAPPTSTNLLRSRVVARIPIANPDGLIEVDGMIWVKTDDGRVVRVDPRRNKVTGSVRLDTATDESRYCQGIGTDGTDVWACAASDSTTGVVRIDPLKLTTGTTAAVDKLFDQYALPHTSRGVWVLSGTGRTVSVVEPGSGAVTSYPLPARCLQLAASEAVVVATCALDNLLVALEPGTGSVRGQVRLPGPRIATVTDDSIWVDTSKGLTRLGLDLTVRAIFPNQYVGLDGDLAVSGNDLWVRGHGGVLWRIDQAHNVVAEQLTVEPPISAGSLLVTAGAIWASAGDEGYLLRISRSRAPTTPSGVTSAPTPGRDQHDLVAVLDPVPAR